MSRNASIFVPVAVKQLTPAEIEGNLARSFNQASAKWANKSGNPFNVTFRNNCKAKLYSATGILICGIKPDQMITLYDYTFKVIGSTVCFPVIVANANNGGKFAFGWMPKVCSDGGTPLYGAFDKQKGQSAYNDACVVALAKYKAGVPALSGLGAETGFFDKTFTMPIVLGIAAAALAVGAGVEYLLTPKR